MIELGVKIHDKFSIEFKVGYTVRRKVSTNDFALNMWIFVPNSLGIDRDSYSKGQFYRDMKSNVRLITPIFLLREIASGSAIPLTNLAQACQALASNPTRTNTADYEYQIKMFAAIFKSALRDEIRHIISCDNTADVDYLVSAYRTNVENISKSYRELRHVINAPTVSGDVQGYFTFGDEFMCNIIEQHTFRLIRKLEHTPELYGKLISELTHMMHSQREYMFEKHYLIVDPASPTRNRELIFRHGVLKKYIESDLFLGARKRRDGVVVEQVYYSLAAGLSMIFATAIAFSFQQKYGNFTMPLFVALVVSYMLKDRIKDLMRYYFAHRLGTKYFDNKTTVSINEQPVGLIREGFDFIPDNQVPPEVLKLRSRSPLLKAENRTTDEKIILFRKRVKIEREELIQSSKYSVAGINEIIRLNVTSFVQKMDNPQVPLYVMGEDDSISVISADKVYYLNIVVQMQYQEQPEYRSLRLTFSRSGIIDLKEI